MPIVGHILQATEERGTDAERTQHARCAHGVRKQRSSWSGGARHANEKESQMRSITSYTVTHTRSTLWD